MSLTFTAQHSVDVINVVGVFVGSVVGGGAAGCSAWCSYNSEAGRAELADPCCKNNGLANNLCLVP